MSLDIKHHAVPRLKALNSSFEASVGQRYDSTFRCFLTCMKLPFLLHTEAIGQYSSSETVPTLVYLLPEQALLREQAGLNFLSTS